MSKLVIVKLKISEVDIDKFLVLTRDLIKNSIVEDGCLNYSLYRKPENKNDFLFYEKYVNSDAVQKHQSSKHFCDFQSSVKPLLCAEPIIEIFDV